jgi:hypothetical protein
MPWRSGLRVSSPSAIEETGAMYGRNWSDDPLAPKEETIPLDHANKARFVIFLKHYIHLFAIQFKNGKNEASFSS